MVTIEQKLTLFSKLLNQDIKEEMDEKLAELEKEFEKKIAENNSGVLWFHFGDIDPDGYFILKNLILELIVLINRNVILWAY